MTAIALRGVRFAYPEGAFVLDLPAWTVARGAKVGVVGPSGCGKSTLLQLLSGERLPEAGTVEVFGTRLHTLSDAARRSWRIRSVGFVFQDFPLVPYLDARDNVLLPYRLHPDLHLDDAVRQRAVARLNDLGLGDKLGRKPDQLSQGERQRVAIARALVTEPALLLADEPTTGLDPRNADGVMALLSEVTRQVGATLVMVTHDPRQRAWFDDVLELEAS